MPTPWWMFLALAAVVVARQMVVLLQRASAHVDCLLQEVRALGGEDRWDTPCGHCGRPIRDAASIRMSTRTEVDGGWVERTDGVFHADLPACAEASERVGGKR